MSGLNGTKINLDHLYCHPIDNNYITTTTSTTTANNANPDIFKIFSENKQLKSMLLLHLDLIQEQSDQLLTKEKNIAQLKEENDILKQKIDRMNQKIRQQKHLKLFNNNVNINLKETIIQQKIGQNNENRCFDNQQRNIQNNRVDEKPDVIFSISTNDIRLSNNISNTFNHTENIIKKSIMHTTPKQEINQVTEVVSEKPQIIDDDDVIICEDDIKKEPEDINDTSNDDSNQPLIFKPKEEICDNLEKSSANNLLSTNITTSVSSVLTEDDESSENLLKLEGNETEDIRTNGIKRKRIYSEPTSTSSLQSSDLDKRQRISRGNHMTTTKPYLSRGWNTDEIDEELKQINENLLLEIPTWVVKECTGCYSIEGTEDLSEETFLKRHQKYEIDERRRKKWDVQRIREQRTIERLKRRHCKKELQEESEEIKKKEQLLSSFYPSPSSIKYIEVTDELPVQAFGENIPKLPPSEFSLPWQSNYHNNRIQFSDKSSMEIIKKHVTKRKYTKSTGSQQK